MATTKQIVNTNLTTIGTLSPYSYQVKGKADAYKGRQFVMFGGVARDSRLTKGQGKGQATRYYAYFMEGDFQHWIELTADTYATLANDPASTLVIVPAPAAEPTAPAPAAEPVAPAAPKGKKAARAAA